MKVIALQDVQMWERGDPKLIEKGSIIEIEVCDNTLHLYIEQELFQEITQYRSDKINEIFND